jgi:hypothetical protein
MATHVVRRALLPNGICDALRAPPSKKSGMMRKLKIHTIPSSPATIRASTKRSTTVARDGSQLTALIKDQGTSVAGPGEVERRACASVNSYLEFIHIPVAVNHTASGSASYKEVNSIRIVAFKMKT